MVDFICPSLDVPKTSCEKRIFNVFEIQCYPPRMSLMKKLADSPHVNLVLSNQYLILI